MFKIKCLFNEKFLYFYMWYWLGICICLFYFGVMDCFLNVIILLEIFGIEGDGICDVS